MPIYTMKVRTSLGYHATFITWAENRAEAEQKVSKAVANASGHIAQSEAAGIIGSPTDEHSDDTVIEVAGWEVTAFASDG